MEELHVLCKTALPRQCITPYKGIAFDGCFFYLTCPDLCQIVKLDNCFCEVECIHTLRPYTCICYDARENCFWASCNECCNQVFQLNCCMVEIDCITVHGNCCRAVVTGVSYDCEKNKLLVSFANCIVLVNLLKCQDEECIQKTCSKWFMDVLSISPGYITIELDGAEQLLAVYDCHSTLKCKVQVPHGYFAENIIFNPCTSCCGGKYRFYLLATKNCGYPYVLECCFDCYNIDICNCNFILCDEKCCNPPCPKPENACNELIESIARIETSLSHVLNAEGEKLQKIIACTEDIDQILCANEAINETLVNVTHLEIILHDKLTAVKDCCHLCGCNPK